MLHRFRYLSDEEFLLLAAEERADYLIRAAEAMEKQRVKLITQTQTHIEKQRKGE